VENVCHGRSFFATESGQIGLGPPDARTRDIVWIFHNGFTPFVLRADTHGIEYQFLGESNVDGPMYGEAFGLDASNESIMFTLH
jgi:hypothetical protein